MPSELGFKEYLIEEEYKHWTGSGYPSTVLQYVSAIEQVMQQEGISDWLTLAEELPNLILKYDKYGAMEKFGAKGHNTVINALKRFSEYVLNATDYAETLAAKWEKMGC